MSTEKLRPAEVYLLLEMGRIARKPPAAVLEVKPGSPEFKALKAAASEHNKKLKAKKKK
jgi:hypothetical protein